MICPECGEPMIFDGLQWTCIECIRRKVASHARTGQPTTGTWVNQKAEFNDHESGRRTFPINFHNR